jgi:hypothetical protein
LEQLVAALLHLGILSGRLLAIEPALFPYGRDGKLRVVPVPVIHVCFGELRAA